MNASPVAAGLGSFALDDDQIYEYEKSVGDAGGIADLGVIRERMEKLGRFGDDTLAHVETGELVVPKPLLDKMPELKESIFDHLREMGVENPERYVVGSTENSINPETGSPEFFLKSVFRGIKKAVKGVGKVLKKVAPLAITVAGTALLGPAGLGLNGILASALSSGIGTLVGGGSVKDALFSAAIGGATGLIAPSVGDVAAGALGGMARSAVGGGDIEDIVLGGAFGAGGAAVGKLAGPSVSRLLGGKASTTTGLENLQADLGRTGDFLDQTVSGQFEKAFAPSSATIDKLFDDPFGLKPAIPQVPVQQPVQQAAAAQTPPPAQQVIRTVNEVSGLPEQIAVAPVRTAVDNIQSGFGAQGEFDAPTQQDIARFNKFDEPSLLRRGVDYLLGDKALTPTQQAVKVSELAKETASQIQAKNPSLSAAEAQKLAIAAAQKQVADAQPGFFGRNRGLLIGGGIAGAAALPSLFEVPEMEEPDVVDKLTPAQREALVAANRLPPSALQAPITSPRQTRVATAPTSFGFNRSLRERFPEMFAEDGGGVFPRRTGGIMPDEGVPGKDSVKAMVMPGEFIFTTKAVKGAGNGSLEQGINNMYSVMRNLEARGERMA